MGDLTLLKNRSMISNIIPASSANTPILLIAASNLIPLAFTIVLITIRIEPNKMAFTATDFGSLVIPII